VPLSIVSPEAIKKLVKPKDIIKKAMADIKWMGAAMKDVQDNKPPPARSDTWNKLIGDLHDFSSTIRDTNLWQPATRGDVSDAAQRDCARYMGVLDAAQNWYDLLSATQTDVPLVSAVIPDLKEWSDNCTSGATSANDLTRVYASLAASPIFEVRDFFSWAAYDMIKVSEALNLASGEAKSKAAKCQKFVDLFPKITDDAKAFLDAYRARIPAMREYCDTHHAALPDHIASTHSDLSTLSV
jgi:hypothetical protein